MRLHSVRACTKRTHHKGKQHHRTNFFCEQKSKRAPCHPFENKKFGVLTEVGSRDSFQLQRPFFIHDFRQQQVNIDPNTTESKQ